MQYNNVLLSGWIVGLLYIRKFEINYYFNVDSKTGTNMRPEAYFRDYGTYEPKSGQ